MASRLINEYPVYAMRTWEFAGADLGDRVSSYKRDDWSSLVMERGADKIPTDVAAKNAWFYARMASP